MSSTTSDEPLSDYEWAAQRYLNFRLFVGSLVAQEEKLAEWATWLDGLPLAVFLAGGDGELKGIRAATTDKQRVAEAVLVLARWSLQYGFDLERITAADCNTITRYILLFAAC